MCSNLSAKINVIAHRNRYTIVREMNVPRVFSAAVLYYNHVGLLPHIEGASAVIATLFDENYCTRLRSVYIARKGEVDLAHVLVTISPVTLPF